MNLDRELRIACDAARAAAAIALGHRGAVKVDHKAGNEPVTQADREANALIVERIAAAFPGDAILSEELPDDGSRFSRDRVWMVDPIDGTRDFIKGDDGFAVMIGLCVGGQPRLGVVCQPTSGALWTGVVGAGAEKQLGGARVPLATSSLREPPGIRLVASKSHRTADIDAFRRALGIDDEMSIGSVGLKVCLVAEGSRDLYVYPGSRTKLWDTCAPEAIVLAAGGRLTDTRGAPLDYGARDLYNRRGLVASNGPLHELAVGALTDVEIQA